MGRPNLPAIHGRFAHAERTGNGVVTIGSHVVVWDGLVGADPEGVFDIGGGNPTRATVPTDWNLVELVGSAFFLSLSTSTQVTMFITKNGSAAYDGRGTVRDDFVASGFQFVRSVKTAPLVVVPGDYFEITFTGSGTGNLVGSGSSTYLKMRRLG